MIEKVKSIIENNGGYLIRNVKIRNELYYLKPFDRTKFSFNSVKSLYNDYYISAMVTSITPMNDESYRKKLEYFASLNEKYGFGLFNVCREKDDYSVGLYGLKLRQGTNRELELAYVVKVGGIVRPLSEIMISFSFETFNLNKLHGEILSYNKESQVIVRQIGMIENGITFCDDVFFKDSYLTNFVLTKEKYNQIKLKNNGQYKLLKFSKKRPINDIHSKARYLHTALEEFNKSENKTRYQHCVELDKYRANRYPRIFKKERENN